MKKIICVSVFIVVLINGYSQTLSAGPKAGINFSTLTNTKESESLTGLNAGGFLVYSIVEHFGVSLDLLYSTEGAKYTTSYSSGSSVVDVENKLRLNYFRIPLLANIFFGSQGDKLRPKICLGPSFGFLTSVKNNLIITTTDGNLVSIQNDIDKDKNGFSSTDLSAIIGAGLNYKVAEMMWCNFDVRYSLGTTDVIDVKQGNDAVENNVFSIDVGIAFGLK